MGTIRIVWEWGVAVFWLAVMLVLVTAVMRAQTPPVRMVNIAEPHPPPQLMVWRVSVGVLAGTTAADILSSYTVSRARPHLVEGNPLVLGTQDGRFTARTAAIQGGMAAGWIATQWVIVRRHPRVARWMKWVNFGASGAHAIAAHHNWRMR